MAKVNKEFQWRMEGMLAACKIVEEKGLEELKKEMKMRGFLKVDVWARKGEVEQLQQYVSENTYCSMLSTTLFTLHDTFGFGKERLHKFKKMFDKNVGNIEDLDWLGDHYVRFEDYAVYLNKNYGFDLNVEKIAALQDLADKEDKRYGRLDTETVIEQLKVNGFKDAATWLERKISR